jgi:hypothetical protein
MDKAGKRNYGLQPCPQIGALTNFKALRRDVDFAAPDYAFLSLPGGRPNNRSRRRVRAGGSGRRYLNDKIGVLGPSSVQGDSVNGETIKAGRNPGNHRHDTVAI